MNCEHGEAKLLTVKKEGPNKGRQFYACAEPKESQCDFFEWATDEVRTPEQNNERTELIGKVLAQMSVKLDKALAMLEKITPVNVNEKNDF